MRELGRFFKAFADETRLRILALLSDGELCVCDLMAVMDLPQSTVSRHLAYLRINGLVSDRREGVWMHYRINPTIKNLNQETWSRLLAHLESHPQAVQDKALLRDYLVHKQQTGG